MPALDVNSHGHGIPAVESFSLYLQQLLDHADALKPGKEMDPAINKADLDAHYGQLADIFAFLGDDPKNRKFVMIDTAARQVFGRLIATTSIDSPDFVRVWNLFDILSIFADHGECDPPLVFWLIEELLDSQTIAGCRKVFDYLESRRERITARHFNSKKLVILRSCNDLLRRLSRAEDTPFCGRVFVFLFQVFPLGDKSSVNLRGEYHVENVTSYDEDTSPPPAPTGKDDDAEKMEVDAGPGKDISDPKDTKDTKDAKDAKDANEIDFHTLYPVFWSLQASFSQPKKMFDSDHFAQFKTGLEASLAAFQKINNQRRMHSSRHAEEARRMLKRKRDRDDELADTYNPKYLTSRDLFQLETSDLTFRRHFLLQSLILMEFLLSLSPAAKKKLAMAKTPNKSVTYSDHVLSDENAAWAAKMKRHITEHIKNSDDDGPYFFRMVDTILARDKNWVRWKIESCQSIERPPVSAEEFVQAKNSAQHAFARQTRRRNNAMGSFSLDFLTEDDDLGDPGSSQGAAAAASTNGHGLRHDRYDRALDKLKDASRFSVPALATFEKEIANEDFDMEMNDDEQSKMLAEERKASKTWRALRIVRQTKLAAFDKIDDDSKIGVVYRVPEDGSGSGGGDADDRASSSGRADAADGWADEPVNRDSLPTDVRPLVLAAGSAESAGSVEALAKLVMQRNPGVFGRVVQHTTQERPPPPPSDAADTEADADAPVPSYHHVDKKTFNVMLDGDRLVCSGEVGETLYGTQKALVDAVQDAGKVPLVLMNIESVQSARDNEFSARYVMVRPSDSDSTDKDTVDKLFDKVLVDASQEGTVERLESFIYGLNDDDDDSKGDKKEAGEEETKMAVSSEPTAKASDEDETMADAAATEEAETQDAQKKEDA